MAVSVTLVNAQNNTAMFTDPLSFEIEYEALTNLQEDLTWKLIYVGSADSDRHDQVLEDVAVGPVVPGTYRFVLQANPPNPQLIPADDLVGITVIMLTGSYREREFIRVGYYVNNEYLDEDLRENPPEQPRIDRLQRCILADHPRVTRYAILFDDLEPAEGPQPMDEGGAVLMDVGQSSNEAAGQPQCGAAMMGHEPMQEAYMEAAPAGSVAFGQQQQHVQYVPVQ